MGRKTRATDRNPAETGKDRFSRYFPRLFAYVYGVTGNSETAKETTLASFSNVINASFLDEHDFTQALFTAARKLTAKSRGKLKADGLTATEREIVSLLFDAQLSREEVGELLEIDADSLLATLVGGLTKLRLAAPAARAGHNLQTLSA